MEQAMITDDERAWQAYPEDRWVYNRLELAQSQGYPCGPAGTIPPGSPSSWWMKPIINLDGMGLGSQPYRFPVPPGYFWMPWFTGEHLSLDFEFTAGVWTCVLAVRARYSDHGRVAWWERVSTEHRVMPSALEQVDSEVVNVETIGGNLIEAHLRRNPDFYGRGWDCLAVVWMDDHRLAEAQAHPDFIYAPEDCDGQLGVPRMGFIGFNRDVGHVPSCPDKMSHMSRQSAAKHGSETKNSGGTRPIYPWPGEPE